MGGKQRLNWVEDLTIYHAQEHKDRLLAALDTGDGLELDLSQVGEIDTAGLQLLILAKQEAARREKTLAIVAHSPAVRETLDFCNLTAFFGDPVIITAREQS
jgi:anti-anti-sigma factor